MSSNFDRASILLPPFLLPAHLICPPSDYSTHRFLRHACVLFRLIFSSIIDIQFVAISTGDFMKHSSHCHFCDITLRFLILYVYFFHLVRKVLHHYFFKLILRLLLSLFSFCYSYDGNVGSFDVVPEAPHVFGLLFSHCDWVFSITFSFKSLI